MRKINTDLPEFIFYYTVALLVDKINEEKVDSEITWNSKGGSVWAGFQFIDFLNNKENNLTANVSGVAASMGAVLLPFFDHVKGSNQSDVMIHSSIGGDKSTIANTNKTLYDALAKKIDESKFKEVTGKNLKDVMLAEDENRVDVWLTGKQAKYIGLYDESYDLLEKAAISDKVDFKELGYDLPENIAIKYGLKENTIKKNKMEIKDVTASMLKTGNVDVYNSIGSEIKTAELKRIKSVLKYYQYDPEKVNQIIESGKELTTDDVEYFVEKKFNSQKLAELEEGSEKELDPAKKTVTKVPKTAEQKEKEAALKELSDKVGLSKFKETEKR
jgi:ATP-dependent protease ClpP protease subunit